MMDVPGPIQVIFTVDTFTRATLGGGLLRHIKYAAALRTHGLQFRWLTLESDVDAAFQDQYAIQVRIVPMPEGLPLHRRRELLLGEALREASLLPPGRRIVTTDSCGVSGSTIRQLWRARAQGIPATHNTSMIPGPLPGSWLGNLRLRLACRAFYGAHALLIPQTQAIKRFFLNYAMVPPGKIETIGNGVDCTRFAPASSSVKKAARERLELADEALVVLSVGSVIPRKGMDLLIKAWPRVLAQFPTAKLVIAGSVGRRTTFMDKAAVLDSYTANILALIEQLPDPASVVLSGHEVEDVTGYYHAADTFAFASEREGLPNAVLEAMACGLPCLLAPYAGFPRDGEELGTAGTHFLPCDHSEGSIAAGLLELLGDAAKRTTMGNHARQLMSEEQSLPMILNQWAAAYHRAAKAWGGH